MSLEDTAQNAAHTPLMAAGALGAGAMVARRTPGRAHFVPIDESAEKTIEDHRARDARPRPSGEARPATRTPKAKRKADRD
jgi:hypothetical protein